MTLWRERSTSAANCLSTGITCLASRPHVRKRLMRKTGAIHGVILYEQDIELGNDFIAKPFDTGRLAEAFH